MVKETSLRKYMVEELIKEIRGPRFGVNELISFDPWSEYLSSIVIPREWKSDSNDKSLENENIVEIDDGLSEDDSNDGNFITTYSSSTLDPQARIKSFGLSFFSDNPNPKLEICATWGRYYKDDGSEKAYKLDGTKTERNDNSEYWKRYSFGEIFEIEIKDDEEDDETIFKERTEYELNIIKTLKNYETEKEIRDRDSDGYVLIHIRRRETKDNLYVFSVFMLNDLNFSSNKKTTPNIESCIFQPSIRINCDEKDLKSKHIEMINDSEKELDLLYQNKPTKAIGHMCSAIWEEIDYVKKINMDQLWPDYKIRLKKNEKYGNFCNPKLRTEFVPLYPATLPNFELDDNDKLNSDDFKAKDLANKSPGELYETLIHLPELYDDWIKKNEEKLDNPPYNNKIAETLIEKEKNASLRIKKGIELIRDEDLVYTSFCFANKTMDLQNKWSQEVKNKNKKEGKDKKIKEFKWRPFQIAFFLMNLEDIYNEKSENKNILDLLWIPTGGGKTEAYLGIMAYTIALRRLKAYENNETGAGTSIISRYTLRLLTVQQFRRTLKMITAAEYLRVQKCENQIGWRPKHSKIKGNWIYGSTRFSTGLWVGGGVSPIHLIKTGGAMDLLMGKESNNSYNPGEPAQILKCPVCGSWLTVPETGLNDEVNELHIVIDSKSMSKKELEKAIQKIVDNSEIDIEFNGINDKNHKPGYYTLFLTVNEKISRNKYNKEIANPIDDLDCEIASLSPINIGYFSSLNEIKGERIPEKGNYDFEIWCTNPECDLNNIEWVEGCPYPNSAECFPDGNYKRDFISPFEENTRMPIPAYLIDDQVYTRCPTVIISTADKIARLAFEPKASAIFGNVTHYNKYFGYNRNKNNIKELYPQLPKGFELNLSQYNKSITPFKAPDLIIQDELHLIDGPLGSLFGLYEAMVSAIIDKQGGNPKYIASTATISNAEKQVDLLFSKKLSQFPPHGLDISDNFFVKDFGDEEAWNDDNPGRLYLGVYAPARGPLTPKIRIWGRMVKVCEDYKNDDKAKNFWTIVGYYNSIRELGGALALYRDDIKNRLDVIYSSKDHRKLNEEDLKELSSRIDSTELPIILDDLERDGLNKIPKYDAIFTTSMFGTGVDVSHLSLMLMNGQPKTTGSYIQATGRIGRDKGGLIVDLLRAGKARDLNHYEMFPSFHSRIYLDVEPVSVSPFSRGCLSRGLGPSMVAFLRNAPDLEEEWEKNQGKTIQNEKSEEDIDFIYRYLRDRLIKMISFEENEDLINSILKNLEKCKKDWKKVSESIEGKSPFEMYEYYFEKPKKSVVLGDSGHNHNKNLKVVYKNAPQSLRDVEETIDFRV